MMKKKLLKSGAAALLFSCALSQSLSAQTVFPGADEKTPSRSQYFSWINNTNEGATEEHTNINLDFFNFLHKEYGMILDIYAFDAGIIDGKNIYGSTKSDRFKSLFPNGFDSVYVKAKSMGTRFGVWGGPDGFGDTEEEAQKRIDEFVELCSKYEWALYKFDAVCGPLRMDKEEEFIELMTKSREHSPDLILLNHRLGLQKSLPYATTFLWEGAETYIDVHTGNTTTAPHNRAGAMARGIVPNLQRLTEDHGVCISSCVDYWDDDLILQAFNRSLILAPEIYGNPWLMADSEFAKLARIYNIHRKYGKILVDGIVLPESYGLYPISRGDEKTRFITLRNLSWNPIEIDLNLNEEIGLKDTDANVSVRLLHPYEEVLGKFKYGAATKVTVEPYRALLVMVTSDDKVNMAEPHVVGQPYQVIKDVAGQPVEVEVLGMPGEKGKITIPKNVKSAKIKGKTLKGGQSYRITFPGKRLVEDYHRKLGDLDTIPVTDDASALYEATIFAADNNALEVRSLERSGETKIPEVKAARDAFFNQRAFVTRGLWDKYLFDGDMKTGFWPSVRYMVDQRLPKASFRLDLGKVTKVDSIVMRVENEFALEPLLIQEGNFAYVSSDLKEWEKITYMAELSSNIPINDEVRYIKLPYSPKAIAEIEVYSNGKKLSGEEFRASNLFSSSFGKEAVKMWSKRITLNEVADKSYLSVAINGEHGIEGAYAAIKIGDEYIGAPSRATSYPSNTWEYVNKRSGSNYTYYIPVDESMVGKEIEVYVMAYDKEKVDIKPEVWISSNPIPFEKVSLELNY